MYVRVHSIDFIWNRNAWNNRSNDLLFQLRKWKYIRDQDMPFPNVWVSIDYLAYH